MDTGKFKRPTQRKGYPGPIQETTKKDGNTTIALISQIVIIVVAVIGCISAVAVAFLGSPVVPYLLPLTSTPTSTLILPSDTLTFTALPSATFTDTPFATFTPVPSETPTPSPMPTETLTVTPVPPKMMVAKWANKYGGEVPLVVKFSATNSYVEFADGTKSYCTTANCKFTWSVRYADSGQLVATPMPWRESFTYTFYQERLYYVTVTVCQGEICGSSDIQVEGK